MEKTFSMIKPDAVQRNICGKIMAMIEAAGLKIVAQKMLKLTSEQAALFYSAHQDKSFFSQLVENITEGPLIVQVLEGEDAIEKYRKLMGSANPAAAEEGTIRNMFGLSIEKNSVHGADCAETAEREIRFFFNQLEITEGTK